MEGFERPAPFTKLARQPVEEFGVRGGRTPKPEIVRRGNEPTAEEALPDTIHNHPRRERIGIRHQPPCQRQPAATRTSSGRRAVLKRRRIERGKHAGNHLLARIPMASLGKHVSGRDLRHLADDLGERQTAEGRLELGHPNLESHDLLDERIPQPDDAWHFRFSLGRRRGEETVEAGRGHRSGRLGCRDLPLNRLVVGRDRSGDGR